MNHDVERIARIIEAKWLGREGGPGSGPRKGGGSGERTHADLKPTQDKIASLHAKNQTGVGKSNDAVIKQNGLKNEGESSAGVSYSIPGNPNVWVTVDHDTNDWTLHTSPAMGADELASGSDPKGLSQAIKDGKTMNIRPGKS